MKVAFVTGSRADWNGLGMVAKAFKADGRFDVAVVVTGQHLEAGTSDLIWNDGFARHDVRLGRKGDAPLDIAKAVGTGVAGLAGRLATLNPDLVVLAGDRYETLSAATAAAVLGIPIAHIGGGDVTEGSMDDKFRNAVTMMADIHFPTNDYSGDRIITMRGLGRTLVYAEGSPALDRIRETPVTVSKSEFCRLVEIDPSRKNILVAFHPVTTDADPAAQCREMIEALRAVDAGIVVLGTNADAGGEAVARLLSGLGVKPFQNLSAPMFYAALTHMDLMIGNSSAGIYETASFGIPVVNVGNRQTGRITPDNVFNCPADAAQIAAAIPFQMAGGHRPCRNPYGDGHSSPRIVKIIAEHFGVMHGATDRG